VSFYKAEDFESVLPETWGRIAAEQCATAANAKRDAELERLRADIAMLKTGTLYRENTRLREALETIADSSCASGGDFMHSIIAKQALEAKNL
jgi:hypothetical protein